MKAKTFVWAVLAAVLGVLGALALVLALTDPFFVVRGLDEEDTALFSNQRYEMAGLIRNQDYSAVVMGTSLVANYRASWFTEGLGKETLKITFPDGWLSEFDTALHLAYQTHPELDTVFFGLDLNILIRPDSQRDVELPMYLYNTNPFDDVQYFLNKETYIQVAKLLVNRLNGGTTTLDNAYVWDGSHEFSREHSLEVYYRLPDVSPPEPEDTYLAAAKENLAVGRGNTNCSILSECTSIMPGRMYLPWALMVFSGTLSHAPMAAMRSLSCQSVFPVITPFGVTIFPFSIAIIVSVSPYSRECTSCWV